MNYVILKSLHFGEGRKGHRQHCTAGCESCRLCFPARYTHLPVSARQAQQLGWIFGGYFCCNCILSSKVWFVKSCDIQELGWTRLISIVSTPIILFLQCCPKTKPLFSNLVFKISLQCIGSWVFKMVVSTPHNKGYIHKKEEKKRKKLTFQNNGHLSFPVTRLPKPSNIFTTCLKV